MMVSDPDRRRDQTRENLLHDILVEAKQSVEEWGGSLYFVYLPAWNRYSAMAVPPERDDVLSAVNKAGLPVLDIHQSFMRQQDPLALFPFRLPGLYTEEGHRLVAEEVLDFISVPR
jgi:hypothetical protein